MEGGGGKESGGREGWSVLLVANQNNGVKIFEGSDHNSYQSHHIEQHQDVDQLNTLQVGVFSHLTGLLD